MRESRAQRPTGDTLPVGRRLVRFTNPDKVLFGASGHTKLDLARCLERVAPAMLPHVRGRPVSMQVFPGGIEHRGHFAKDAPGHFPDWIHRVTVPKRGGTVTHVVADDAATLVYLAGQNVVTPHVWLSRADAPNEPDRLIFDLDPSRDAFAEVRAAARSLGDLLRDLGLVPFAMTTGSRGIHVVAPLRNELTFESVREVAWSIGERLVEGHPERLTMESRKAKRGERIYVDVLRNGWGQTAVPPYAARPRPGAPVAMPRAGRSSQTATCGPTVRRSTPLRREWRRRGTRGRAWAATRARLLAYASGSPERLAESLRGAARGPLKSALHPVPKRAWRGRNRGILREMADRWDDDDWVGEPPEGHYTRDRAKPEFWRRNWPVAAASSGLLLVLIVVVLVLALK